MSNIWFTSDLHLGHDREFLWGPRGFKSVYEMNEAILENWRNTVGYDDDVYVLGDLMLGNNEEGIKLIKTLKGKLHIIRGNHDTDVRMQLYSQCWNVVEITEGQYLKVNGQNFYLCHYPTMTSNLEKNANLKGHTINLFGHTHQKTNFYQGIPFMYHVGLDSHNCKPVSLEEVLSDIGKEAATCLSYL